MGIPVTIGSDWTLPLGLPHAILAPSLVALLPPLGYFPMWPHVEPPIPIDWPPGFGSHHLTTSVFHKGSVIAQNHHDCGSFVLHFTDPPDNIFLTLFFLFSKRKVEFGASTVLMQGHAAGLAAPSPYLPMLNCADIVSLPINFPFTSSSNTVYLGATEADKSRGWAEIWTQISFEAVLFLIGPCIEHLLPKKLTDHTLRHALEKLALFLLKTLKTYVLDPALTPSDHGHDSSDHDATEHAEPPAHEDALVVPSQFGDASMTSHPSDDGTFTVAVEAPSTDGNDQRTRTSQNGLPAWPPVEGAGRNTAPPVDPLVTLVAEAPLL